MLQDGEDHDANRLGVFLQPADRIQLVFFTAVVASRLRPLGVLADSLEQVVQYRVHVHIEQQQSAPKSRAAKERPAPQESVPVHYSTVPGTVLCCSGAPVGKPWKSFNSLPLNSLINHM